jgi:hypothetical protein
MQAGLIEKLAGLAGFASDGQLSALSRQLVLLEAGLGACFPRSQNRDLGHRHFFARTHKLTAEG